MVEIEKESLLVAPEDFNPTNKNLEIVGAFNPGAARLKNKNIILYVRVNEKIINWEDNQYFYSPRSISSDEKYIIHFDKFKKNLVHKSNPPFAFYFQDSTLRLTYISHLRKVILNKDGLSVKKIDNKPSFYGLENEGELGIEDARITYLADKKKYFMTYVTLSRNTNISTSYAISSDCLNWKRQGIMFPEQNKDVVLFPEKINNKYTAFHRPSGDFEFSKPSIWLSYSKDLQHWGEDKIETLSGQGNSWDSHKIGAGCPPIKTKKGWLEIYHGVKKARESKILHFFRPKGHLVYCAGAALFNLKNPQKLISRSPSNKPLLSPTRDYEKQGFVNNVVFPSGCILDEDNESLLIYSGGADRVTTVKKIKIKDIFNHLKVK